MAIVRQFSHDNDHYYHELNRDDDSITLCSADKEVLLTYTSYCVAQTQDAVIGNFSIRKKDGKDRWVFEDAETNEVIWCRPACEVEGLVDSEVEISKRFLDVLTMKDAAIASLT